MLSRIDLPADVCRQCREATLLCRVAMLLLCVASGLWRLVLVPGRLLMQCSRGKGGTPRSACHLLDQLHDQGSVVRAAYQQNEVQVLGNCVKFEKGQSIV